jgi:spermidine synthase
MTILHDRSGHGVRITVTEEQGVRYLYLDGCEEGAMALESEAPIFNYLWFAKCSRLALRPPHRILILGAGAFTAAKCLALDHPRAAIDVVDIEPELESIGRLWFRLDDVRYERLHFHGTAAELFLAKPAITYGYVFDDLFDGYQHVPLAGRGTEHVQRLASAIDSEGVAVKNMIWDPNVADTVTASSETARAWKQAFPQTLLVTLGNPNWGHNRLLIGRKSAVKLLWDQVREELRQAGTPDHVLDLCREAELPM